jgi:hypothetical protein
VRTRVRFCFLFAPAAAGDGGGCAHICNMTRRACVTVAPRVLLFCFSVSLLLRRLLLRLLRLRRRRLRRLLRLRRRLLRLLLRRLALLRASHATRRARQHTFEQ